MRPHREQAGHGHRSSIGNHQRVGHSYPCFVGDLKRAVTGPNRIGAADHNAAAGTRTVTQNRLIHGDIPIGDE